MNSTETGQGRRIRVLFLCTHNSARSQMAEAILRHLGGDKVEVHSAGTVATRVHPLAIAAMAEKDMDISGQRSKHLDEFSGQVFDYVVTVCDNARESCPIFPGAPEEIHWSLDAALYQGLRLRLLTRIAERATRGLCVFSAAVLPASMW